VRLWLSESERRPDPAPARADARKALLAGTLGWLVVFVVCLSAGERLEAAGLGWLTTAAAVGIALGVIGLVVVQAMRRRVRQSSSGSSAPDA